MPACRGWSRRTVIQCKCAKHTGADSVAAVCDCMQARGDVIRYTGVRKPAHRGINARRPPAGCGGADSGAELFDYNRALAIMQGLRKFCHAKRKKTLFFYVLRAKILAFCHFLR